MSLNRFLLLLAALMLLGALSCTGGDDSPTTPGPGGGGTLNPEDLVPEVQVTTVDMRYRTSQWSDEPMGNDPIPGIIASARSSLDVALPRLNRQEIVSLLVQAAARGVQVRVVTEKGYFDDPAYRPFYDQLLNAVATGGNLSLETDNDGFPRLMNARFLIIDSSRVVTGSYTWESADFERTIGDVVSIQNTNVAAAFTSQFNQMFAEGNFGVEKRVESQQSFLVGGGSALLDVHFGPNDRLRELIQTEIEASGNVHATVQQFKDLTLANYMVGWIAGNENRQLALTLNNIRGAGDEQDNIIYNAFAQFIVNPPDDTGHFILSGLGVETGPVTQVLDPFLNYATVNSKLVFADRARTNNVPAVITTTANFTDLAFTLNDEVMLILRGRPLVNKYIRGPFQDPIGLQRWSVNWNTSLTPAGLSDPDDLQELDAMGLMFPYLSSRFDTEGGAFRPFNSVPTGLIFGRISNFRPSVIIQEPGSEESEEVNIDVAFRAEGNTFFGVPFATGNPVPIGAADPFVNNRFINPDHKYMIVVPAGTLELSAVVMVDDAPDGRFQETTRTVSVGPGGVREVNFNINLAPQAGGQQGTF